MDTIQGHARYFLSGETLGFPGVGSLIRATLFEDGTANRSPESTLETLGGDQGKTCRITDYEWGPSPMLHMPELSDADKALMERMAKLTNRMIDRLLLGAMMTGAEPACTNASTVASSPGPTPELAPMPPCVDSRPYSWDSEQIWSARMWTHPMAPTLPSVDMYFSALSILGPSEPLPDWRYLEHPGVPVENEDGTPCFSHVVKDELLPEGIAKAYVLHPDTAARMRWVAAMDELLWIPTEFLRPLPGGMNALKLPLDTGEDK